LPSFQPRQDIGEEKLEQLLHSIKNKGVLQPVILRKKNDRFEVIAGRRRVEAAKKAQMKTIPAVIREFSDEEALQVGIIENLHRKDLNPLEEAQAYQKLIQDFGYSLEDIERIVKKDKTTVSNILRLLKLPPIIQQALREEKITLSHARTLLSIQDPKEQMFVFEKILKDKPSVRAVEVISKKYKVSEKKSTKPVDVLAIEDELRKDLGVNIRILWGKKLKLVIEFKDLSQLKNFTEKLLRR